MCLPPPTECNQIPEAVHPKSFRSSFDQGTRLWAVHEGAAARNLSRPGLQAGMLPLDYELNRFFTPRKWGTGRRFCSKLEPSRRVRLGDPHGGELLPS